MRDVFGRIRRLEARVVASTRETMDIRVLLVHPEKGLTGVLVFGADNSRTEVPPTPEEVERVRADLERRRAAGLLGKGGARDTHAYAPA